MSAKAMRASKHEARERRGDARLVKRLNPDMHSGISYSWAVMCPLCKVKAERSAAPDSPPEHLSRLFRKDGWVVDSECHVAACPRCEAQSHAGGSHKQPEPDMTSTTHLKAQRLMHDLLREHFDEDRGHYADGWSDKRIADQTQLSERFVLETREGAYGLLRPQVPSELIELKDEFMTTRTQTGNELAELRELIESTAKSLSERQNAFAVRLDALFQQFHHA